LAEAPYQKYLKTYGGVEGYANAIKERLASGGKIYDVPAATQFQKDYPQYFNSSNTLNPVRSTMESKGYKVDYEAKTQTGTVAHPDNPYVYRYDFKTTKYPLDKGTTYMTTDQLSAIENKITPPYYKTYNELSKESNDLVAQLSKMSQSYLDTINNTVKQYGDAGLVMLKTYQDNYANDLAQVQKLMTPSTEVPESVKLAIQILKDQTKENIEALNEEMIRRGIYRSGLAATEAAKLKQGALTNEQQLLANWLDHEHQKAYQATLQYANMLTNYASGYANVYQQAVLQPLSMQMNAAQTAYQLQSSVAEKAYDTAASLRKWLAEQQTSAQKSALEYQTEQEKQAAELEKWLAEQELKEKKYEAQKDYWNALAQAALARAAEQARHNKVMETKEDSSLGNDILGILSGGDNYAVVPLEVLKNYANNRDKNKQ